MPDKLATFRKLSLTTTIVTYGLILVGALVRASGSGLGCPDWPKCFGGWVPPMSVEDLPPEYDAALFNLAQTWTEYLNRLLGVLVGLLIFATLISAIKSARHRPRIIWPTAAAFVLVGFEGWLGSIVVKHELAAWTVTVHLVGALGVVSLLLYATFHAFAQRNTSALPPPQRKRLQNVIVGYAVLLLVQLAIGTIVRGDVEVTRMTTELARADWLGTVGRIDIVHRQISVLCFFVALGLLWYFQKSREQAPMAFRCILLTFVLTGAQILIGLSLAYVGFPAVSQVLHLTVASLMFGALTWAWLALAARSGA